MYIAIIVMLDIDNNYVNVGRKEGCHKPRDYVTGTHILAEPFRVISADIGME